MDEQTLTTALNNIRALHELVAHTPERRLGGGTINPCFDLGGQIIVRFNVVDASLPKLSLEAETIRLLRDCQPELPLPEIVSTGVDGMTGLEYSISKPLPGKPVRDRWPSLEEPARRAIAESAGRYLAMIHTIEIDWAGWICDRRYPRTWSQYLADSIAEQAGSIRQAGGLTSRSACAIADFAARTARLLPRENLRLLHGDFHSGNLLTDGHTITGIIDLEWCHGGTPAFEWASMADGMAQCPGIGKSLRFGYESIAPLRDLSYQERLLYSIQTHLELIAACDRRGALWPAGSDWKERALAFLNGATMQEHISVL